MITQHELDRLKGARDGFRRRFNVLTAEIQSMVATGHVHGKSRGKLKELLEEQSVMFHQWCSYDAAMKILGVPLE